MSESTNHINSGTSGIAEERIEFGSLNDLRSEFANIPWAQLFPWKAWIEDRPWTLVWVQFLVFAFGFPFVLMQFYAESTAPLEQAAWAFSLYFSILWAAFLQRCLRPQKLGFKRLASTWLFTSVIGVFAVLLVSAVLPRIPGFHFFGVAPESANVFRRLVGFTFGVGLIEESAKLIPVVWFATRLSSKTQPVTLAFLGVISGLAFGATESIVYSVLYAMGNAAHTIGYGDYLMIQILRFVSLPLLHAVWTGIAGYFIGLSMLRPTYRRPFTVIGLCLVAVLHGAYDTFANNFIGLAIAFISLLVFVSYVRNSHCTLKITETNEN